MDDKVYGHFMRTLTGELLSIYNFTLLQWTMSRQGEKIMKLKLEVMYSFYSCFWFSVLQP